MVDTRICRKVDETFWARLVEHLSHFSSAREVDALVAVATVASETRQPRLLEAHVAVVVDDFEVDDLVAALDTPLCDIEADESGGSGEEMANSTRIDVAAAGSRSGRAIEARRAHHRRTRRSSVCRITTASVATLRRSRYDRFIASFRGMTSRR